jgi:hypothetical protein
MYWISFSCEVISVLLSKQNERSYKDYTTYKLSKKAEIITFTENTQLKGDENVV